MTLTVIIISLRLYHYTRMKTLKKKVDYRISSSISRPRLVAALELSPHISSLFINTWFLFTTHAQFSHYIVMPRVLSLPDE